MKQSILQQLYAQLSAGVECMEDDPELEVSEPARGDEFLEGVWVDPDTGEEHEFQIGIRIL